MLGKNKMDRRGSGPLWFLMLVVTVYILYSAAIAIATGDDCGRGSKHWVIAPPGWECDVRSG